jgi:chromosome segregation ATPase
MGAAREKDQADFDLERFVELFDEALMSQDPRVMKTLRDLMMIVALTRPESRNSGLHDRNAGPLRRLYEDVNHLNRRLMNLEEEVRSARQATYNKERSWPEYEEKYTLAAAQKVAQQIDQDAINQLKAVARAKGVIPPAGKLYK